MFCGEAVLIVTCETQDQIIQYAQRIKEESGTFPNFDDDGDACGMTSDYDQRLLRNDVEEYTRELRTNPLLDDLRTALENRGFDADSILMAGYLENEEGVAVGAIVSADQKVYEFEHHDSQGAVLERFDEIDDPESVSTYIYAVMVAVEMAGDLGE